MEGGGLIPFAEKWIFQQNQDQFQHRQALLRAIIKYQSDNHIFAMEVRTWSAGEGS
jgi:hypothetical protein